MSRKAETTADAVGILYRRLYEGQPERLRVWKKQGRTTRSHERSAGQECREVLAWYSSNELDRHPRQSVPLVFDNACMQVTIELPDNIASVLASGAPNISRAVLEVVMVTGVRDESISQAQARRIPGLSRYEVDGLMKRHGSGRNTSIEALERDTDTALAFSAE